MSALKPRSLGKGSTKRLLFFSFSGAIGILTTLFAIFHLSQAATNPGFSTPHYTRLLVLTLIGIILLTAAAIWQTVNLVKRLRKHQSGARLSLSFALRMLFTSLIPVGIIAGFTWLFLSYDLGQIFNRQISVALQDALQITRSAVGMRARQALAQSESLAAFMQPMDYAQLVAAIEPMRRNANALELSVFDQQGNLVAFAHQDLAVMTVEAPSSLALLQVDNAQEYFEFANNDADGYTIKVVTDISKANREPYYLQAIFSLPDSFNRLAENVRASYEEHQSFLYLQPHITASLLFVLGLILTLTVLSALWISALFGDTMTRPVRQLIEATKQVIQGDFSTPITDMPNNDLGTLGNNFNAMLLTLRDAESMNYRIQDELSDQNNFLNALLDNLSAGVLTLDWHGRLQRFNPVAAQLLDSPLSDYQGQKPPRHDTQAHDAYGELMLGLQDILLNSKDSWRTEITLSRFSTRKTLICHGAPLPLQNRKQRGGQVIVFEDVTEFQHNQRNAAWEEVARRLAHEIKNPLTPIRLQGERLQRKLNDKLADEERRILERATSTIINQVDAMQQMVADFSQFAKPLELRRQAVDMNHLIREIADMYPETPISLDLDSDLPRIFADAVQMRQVLHNLMKNAVEAMSEENMPAIRWQSSRQDKQTAFSIEDAGTGFTNLHQDPFEPYVTGKSKGTGLGLAIVKKIINEHGGSIQAGHAKTLKGAKISFILPIENHNE
ncbi:sensor histidine kinase [Suttonella indologenes]|uniref:histidine kinase n=1 Tax=Suttonella indologenes TaxID=13276 RepID=A0A380MUN1_9GAMM|nr:ATP-binding protein [Suttonella indologenes]SUO95972.1 Alginate biosynthesis sensor protein kinB [Suttonella indologenes]